MQGCQARPSPHRARPGCQDEWYRRAELALGKGDEELAREALKRRKSYQENADSMKAQLSQQRAATSQLIANTKRAPAARLRTPRRAVARRWRDAAPTGGAAEPRSLLVSWFCTLT